MKRLCVLLLVLAVLLCGCSTKKNEAQVRIPLTEFSAENLPRSMPEDLVESVSSTSLAAPVCLIEYVYERKTNAEKEEGAFFVVSPGLEGFTADPSAAKTVLYAICENFLGTPEYSLFVLSGDNAYPCLSEKGKAFSMGFAGASDTGADQYDVDFCKTILKHYTLSEQEEGTVLAEAAVLDTRRSMLSGENVGVMCRAAYDCLSRADFTGSDVNGLRVEWDGIEAVPPVLVIDRNNCPESTAVFGDRYSSGYDYPDYDRWLEGAAVQYCVTDEPAPPRSVLVCENTAYYDMGEYEKIGTLYSYITRYTLYDLQEDRIVSWTDGHASPQPKGANVYGAFRATGGHQVQDKKYPSDGNGFQMYDRVYGSGWENVIGFTGETLKLNPAR